MFVAFAHGHQDALRTRFGEYQCEIATSCERSKGQAKGVFWVFCAGQRTGPVQTVNP